MGHHPKRAKLHVTIHEAKGLKGGGLLRSLDPYCIVQVGNRKYKTTAVKGGGHCHKFDHGFTFHLRGDENVLCVTLLNKDSNSPEAILGYGELSLADLDGNGKYHGEIPLKRKNGKSGGVVKVTMKLKHAERSISPIPGAKHRSRSQYPRSDLDFSPPSSPGVSKRRSHSARRSAHGSIDSPGKGGNPWAPLPLSSSSSSNNNNNSTGGTSHTSQSGSSPRSSRRHHSRHRHHNKSRHPTPIPSLYPPQMPAFPVQSGMYTPGGVVTPPAQFPAAMTFCPMCGTHPGNCTGLCHHPPCMNGPSTGMVSDNMCGGPSFSSPCHRHTRQLASLSGFGTAGPAAVAAAVGLPSLYHHHHHHLRNRPTVSGGKIGPSSYAARKLRIISSTAANAEQLHSYGLLSPPHPSPTVLTPRRQNARHRHHTPHRRFSLA